MGYKYEVESYALRGCFMNVFNELKNGFAELVYHDALIQEFEENNIPYIHEAGISINYKGKTLNHQYFADFLCYDKIIVEVKAHSTIINAHRAQLYNYLRATNIEFGFLVNFGGEELEIEKLYNHNLKADD